VKTGGQLDERLGHPGVVMKTRCPRDDPSTPRSRAWSIVSTPVPVKRSITMLLERARATNSWNCVAISSSSSRLATSAASRHRSAPRAQQTMPGHRVIERQESFAQRQGARVREAEADVVAQRAHVGHVVVQAFEFEQHRAQFVGARADFDTEGLFDGLDEREAVADGAVAGDLLREVQREVEVRPSKSRSMPLCTNQRRAFMRTMVSPSTRNESAPAQSRRVHGPTGSRRSGTLDRGEGKGVGVGVHGGLGSRVVTHGVPSAGPVLVQHESAKLGVTNRLDAKEVVHLTFESTGGVIQVRDRRNSRLARIEQHPQFDSLVGRTVDEQVDDFNYCFVVARTDERQTESGFEQPRNRFDELVAAALEHRATWPLAEEARHVQLVGHHFTTTIAAARKSVSSGHASTPIAPHATSPPIRGTLTFNGLLWATSRRAVRQRACDDRGTSLNRRSPPSSRARSRRPIQTNVHLGAQHVELADEQAEGR